MKDFELESLATGVEHSQKVKTTPVASNYGSKDCVNLSPSTAVSRIIQVIKLNVHVHDVITTYNHWKKTGGGIR